MVICNSHNFIYLRIPKNASSSLAEFFVRNFCDENDAYTQYGTRPDLWTEVNDCQIPSHNIPPSVFRKYGDKFRFIHLTLSEIVGEGLVKETELYHKRVISVLRDPLMRQLSLYFFLTRNRLTPKSPEEFRHLFREGKHETDPSNCILQTEYAKVNGIDYGDYWLYNNLDRYVEAFCKQLNVTPKSGLGQFKAGFKPKGKDQELIERYYDQKTIDAVRKYYEKDYEKLFELNTGLTLA